MNDFSARMAALRVRFVAQAGEEIEMLGRNAAAGEWDAVRDASHRLAGRAGMFGFAAMGEIARALEEAIEAGAGVDALRGLVDALLAEAKTLPAG